MVSDRELFMAMSLVENKLGGGDILDHSNRIFGVRPVTHDTLVEKQYIRTEYQGAGVYVAKITRAGRSFIRTFMKARTAKG